MAIHSFTFSLIRLFTSKEFVLLQKIKHIKMKNITQIILLITAISLPFLGLQAQNVYVLPTNAAQKSYPLSEIKEISFANRNIYIAKSTDTVQFPLADLQYLSFIDYGDVSIAENTGTDGIKLYPNPTTDYLVLSLVSVEIKENIRYELYDINGKIVRQSDIHSENTIIQIADMSPAVYVLKITETDKEIKSFKIIKK